MKVKTVFFCTACGNETPKWQGRCTACGAWNTIAEQPAEPKNKPGGTRAASGARHPGRAKPLHEVDGSSELRFGTGLGEFDRVLGGGAVRGSLVLVGGAPGVGKSTLLLQICGYIGQNAKILYVTGEESERQLKMRAQRLGVNGGSFYVMAETALDDIVDAAGELEPDVMIVDSIQTLYSGAVGASPGSVVQVKECTMSLLQLSKQQGVTVFLVGHVNKEGAIAGPKVLEHMVDCVLYFEGEQASSYRILRAAKNRFGSTNEIGVFEMLDKGLAEVANPSELLLSGRPEAAPGTCVTCVIEGTRPILAEIQALVTASCYNVPRRNANGVEYNRAMMLLAVLEKRSGLRIAASDAYINVIGGLTVDEPSADLAIILALASSFRDKPVREDLVAVGEVGLTGELRPVAGMTMRLAEARRLGFKTVLVPKNAMGKVTVPEGLTVLTARNISEAIAQALS
jgi:DNA repair protein RadA/Sms